MYVAFSDPNDYKLGAERPQNPYMTMIITNVNIREKTPLSDWRTIERVYAR